MSVCPGSTGDRVGGGGGGGAGASLGGIGIPGPGLTEWERDLEGVDLLGLVREDCGD